MEWLPLIAIIVGGLVAVIYVFLGLLILGMRLVIVVFDFLERE